MIYLKSILVGLCFLAASAILLPLGFVVFSSIFAAPRNGEEFGFDPVSMVKSSPVLWILAVLFFSLGYAWEYRRVTSR